MVQWNSPARPNGDIVSYTVHHKDPVQLDVTSTLITPDESEFSARHITLHGLAAYHRSVTAAPQHTTVWVFFYTPNNAFNPLAGCLFILWMDISHSRFSTDKTIHFMCLKYSGVWWVGWIQKGTECHLLVTKETFTLRATRNECVFKRTGYFRRCLYFLLLIISMFFFTSKTIYTEM